MKNFKRILALVLAVMMVATSVVAISAAEADEKVVYNAEAITRLNKLGIFQGYNAADMGADDNVTRAQMALFTGRVLTGKVESNYWESYVNDTTFEDIADIADYYVGAIAYAYENGVVIGKSDVAFDPNGNVTYQEALTMVVRSLGYTGLSYPNGFINKAMKLGLTNGIANVAYGDAAVRGVIATILYNALYAEDSLFADNFGLTSGTYMLVATPTLVKASGLKIPGASINGYFGKELNEGYVAFAPIGADNKAVNAADKYVYARVSQIADDLKGDFVDEHYADKLGYAFNLTFENNVLTWGNECASKTFVNYGDNREITITEIDYDHKWDGTFAEDYFLTFGNQAYNLVDGTKADYNSPTSTQDIILYADYGMEAQMVADYVQMFEGNDIVVYENNVEVYRLEWNEELKAYFKWSDYTKDYTVKATAEDILAAISCYDDEDGVVSGYGQFSDYATIKGGDVIASVYENTTLGTKYDNFNYAVAIAANYFCEITAMDYDNDGLYDAAIYTPYYLGYVNDLKERNDDTTDGKELTLTGVVDAAGKTVLDGISEYDYTFTGAVKAPASWQFYLYSYNRLTNEINVKEVAKSIDGKVEWGVKGAVAPGSFIYEDSQVSIGGTVYQVGGWYYNNLYGLKALVSPIVFDGAWVNKISDAMGVKVTPTYYNGWNDVLDFGMTDACSGFKGIVLAGHLIHGVPKLSAAADYSYAIFNPYQSEFALENDQIVVDAIVDASGKYQTIKINSIDSMEFTELEYQIFKAYCDVFYANLLKDNSEKMISVYSYYFDADRLATHQATPLYKAIEREFIIDRLTSNYVDVDGDELAENITADKNVTLVYAVGGKNDDGSYKLYNFTNTTKGSNPNKAEIEFNLGVSDAKFIDSDSAKPIRTNADTVFTFVAKDGVYTYVGMPADGYKIDLRNAPAKSVFVADSKNIMIVDTTRCISEIAVAEVDWTEKVQDVARAYATDIHTTCDDAVDGVTEVCYDNANRCDAIYRNHMDTWAFVEYVPYVEATFHYDEVYMVTGKTANTKIYADAGELYYVYSNLYNLVDCKYEESVIFTGAEVAVFKALEDAYKAYYESGAYTDVDTNYGFVIVRDAGVVDCLTYADFKADVNANAVFNLWDAFGNTTDLERGVYGGQAKDNTGAVAFVTIGDAAVVVNKVEFVTVYNTVKGLEVGTFANIADGAVMFYTYDDVTGTLTGYAFN